MAQGAVNIMGEGTSSDVQIAATTPRSRGRCPVCGYSVALRKDGTMLAHLLYGIGFGGRPVHCNGGGRDPLAPNEKHVWETPDAR